MSDGTETLCQVLYGRKPKPTDYLGGSDARMLHDKEQWESICHITAEVEADN